MNKPFVIYNRAYAGERIVNKKGEAFQFIINTVNFWTPSDPKIRISVAFDENPL